MARIRTIKPSFFQSEDVSALPLRARLTWIGLWTHCDDQGRTKDNVKLIKANVWALDDVSLRDVEDDLETLAARGRIVRYEVDGVRYLAVVNWHDHQKIQKATQSKIPPPEQGSPVPPGPGSGTEQCASGPVGASLTPATGPGSDSDSGGASSPLQASSCRTTEPLQESSGSPTAGKGKEGKGKEGRAPNGAQRAPARASPADLSADAASTAAHEHVAVYADQCRQRPVASVRRKLARYVQELLNESWPDQLIERSLAVWGEKGLDPSVLPSVANEVANKALGRNGTNGKPTKDDKLRALQRLKSAPLQAIEGGSAS